MQDDLQVVGFNLDSWREVLVAERPMETWRAMGAGRAESLVCFFCFHGFGAPAGTRVPLTVRHSLAGPGSGHFVHPSGAGPAGGHSRDLVWHVSARYLLARWARSRRNVHSVRLEPWTPGHSPRADIAVRMVDGTAVVVEVPHEALTGLAWRDRHRSHRTTGARDIWVWQPGAPLPQALLDKNVPVWSLDVLSGAVATLLGTPHRPRPPRWWDQDDLSIYASHHPPCPRDNPEPRHVHLGDLELDRNGMVLPAALRRSLHEELQEVRREAGQERHRTTAAEHHPATSTPGRAPAPHHSQPLLCSVCHERLDPALSRTGRHMLC
ncbi:hypothetical protein ACFC26_12795 [Kitasatospora purpeofusca]|uniref:hypothetical protein n=1 Tax=Kitasatospora purpeofusca TaxID=67352 RepID=UPI0035DE7A4B